ncbi:MAG: hypothetical protein WCS39_05900, partial [Bacteroidales bacterium]
MSVVSCQFFRELTCYLRQILTAENTKSLRKGNRHCLFRRKLEIIKTFLSNHSFLKAAKGLYYIHSVWIKIVENVRGIKTLLRRNKGWIIETIDFVIPLMGLKHACKLFQITTNQFYAWKRKVQCALSPIDICMKQNPLTVSPTELNIIKEFVKDQEYKNFPLVAVYYEMMRKGKAFMS